MNEFDLDQIGFKLEYFTGLEDYIILLVAGLCILIFCLTLKKSNGNKIKMQQIIWFCIWVCFIFKGTRGELSSKIFHLVLGGSVLLLFITSVRMRYIITNQWLLFFLLCYWFYILIAGVWFSESKADSFNGLIILSLLWFAVASFVFTQLQLAHILHIVFSGSKILLVSICLMVTVFTIFWPTDSISHPFRIIGPFVNGIYLSHSLALLIIGIIFERYMIGNLNSKSAWDWVVVILGLSGLLLTLSRSGICLGFGMVFWTVALLARKKDWLIMVVTLCIIAGVFLLIPKAAIFTRLNAGDNGRLSLLQNQFAEAQKALLYGHGFGASKVANFESRNDVKEELACHNFILGVFYDLGMPGLMLALLIIIGVSIELYRIFWLTKNRSWLLLLIFWIHLLGVSITENMFWDGNVILSSAVTLVLFIAVRGRDVHYNCRKPGLAFGREFAIYHSERGVG